MIEVINICKSFDTKTIFKNFSLEVKSGEFLGIMGKSGRGKTTLLNIMGTLEKVDSGTVKIMGKDIHNRKIQRLLLRDSLGFVFQNYALIDNASVNENLQIAINHKKMNKKEKQEAILSTLKEVGLDNYGKKIIHTLSGGEQQRIAIARILLKDPTIIFADEPTGSLDSENRDIIVSLFQKLHNMGKTIVMVTHDQNLTKFFSRVIEL